MAPPCQEVEEVVEEEVHLPQGVVEVEEGVVVVVGPCR